MGAKGNERRIQGGRGGDGGDGGEGGNGGDAGDINVWGNASELFFLVDIENFGVSFFLFFLF